ncbi:MAG TPA: hypothetical protein VN922_24770 [Bacteroidia bacterium]|nr:hypothetical protein [Bacteroidia bacterium]
MKNYHSFIVLIVLLLTGCSSYSSLSSFGSRKYTKGFFNNAPAEKPVAERIDIQQKILDVKAKIQPENATASQNNRIAHKDQGIIRSYQSKKEAKQAVRTAIASLNKVIFNKQANKTGTVNTFKIEATDYFVHHPNGRSTSDNLDESPKHFMLRIGLIFMLIGLICFAIAAGIGLPQASNSTNPNPNPNGVSDPSTTAVIFLLLFAGSFFLLGLILCLVALIVQFPAVHP